MQSRIKSQSQNRVLLLGYGYTAKALARHLLARGDHVQATYRKAPEDDARLAWVKFGSADMRRAFAQADHVLISVPPKGGIDPALTALRNTKTTAQWIGYLSATSVYGDRGGQWAFEAEPPTPSLKRGRARAEAEIAWIETGWPVHIFRLAGIYGPGRAPFEKLKAGTARAVIKPGHAVNRIHVEDIASALLASMARPNPQRIYNLADGNPAPPQDVLDFAAELIDAPKPPRVGVDSPDVSAMARTFYAESKKIDIARARAELRWTPQYPAYQDGLRAILDYGKE